MYRKTPSLMERVVTRENMKATVKSVKRNKGAAGIDGMTVSEIEEHMKEYYIPLRNKLLNGTYKPQPVKGWKYPNRMGTSEN